MSLFRRLVIVAFFLEIGLLLIVIPWSAYWDRNYFSQAWPWLGVVLRNNFVRGGISGLGLVDCYVGLLELVAVFGRWWHGDTGRGPTPAGGGVA